MPKENFQVKPRSNRQNIDLCYEPEEDKEGRMQTPNRSIEMSTMTIMEMDKEENRKIEGENKIITTKHVKNPKDMRKTKTKNKIETIITREIIDNIKMVNT